MIDTILAAATVKSIEEIMTEAGVPYEVRDDEEKAYFYGAWDDATDSERDLALRQAAPAIRRILSKEAYAYRAKEGPLIIRFNYQKRKIEKRVKMSGRKETMRLRHGVIPGWPIDFRVQQPFAV